MAHVNLPAPLRTEQDLDAESWFETSSGEEHQGLSSKTGSLIFAKISAKN
ncbi:MAG: hypothetical protein WCI25_07885 [Actinomycetes bacterium]